MKNIHKKLINSIILIFLAGIGNSQIDIYYENFEGASSGFTLNTSDVNSSPTVENKWIVNNAYDGGSFFNLTCFLVGSIVATPDQTAPITGFPRSKYMHIYSNTAATGGSNVFNCNFVVTDNAASTCVTHGNSFAKQTTPVSTVGKTGVNVSFYWICSAGSPVVGEAYYSLNNGSSWTLITSPNTNYSGASTWTLQTITNPAFDNQPSLQFGFRFVAPATTASLNDPAFGIDEFRIFTPGTVANTISTTFAPAASYCPNGALSVPFTSTGTFTSGNTYNVQLSDATGGFTAPVSIGTLNSTANSGNISATIPPGTPAGNGYKIRVVSSNPSITGSANSTAFAIESPPAAGTVEATTSTSVCTNGTASFSVTGGTGSIVWQQSANGTDFTDIGGANSTTYTSSALSSNTYFRASFVNACGAAANSNNVLITVGGIGSVSLTANPPNINSLCGGPITLSIPSGYTSIVWSSGPTAVNSIVVNSPGSYSVNAVSSAGCQVQSDTITIVQSENPTAGFSFDQPNPGDYLVNFTNTSSNSSSYFWDFGNGFTTTAANPSFTFTSDGNFPIRLIATNACGSDTIDITIEVLKVGIRNVEWNIDLSVYPNPFQHTVRIETELGKPEKLELTIFNMIGKLVHTETYTSTGKSSKIVDLSDVSKGIYLINLKGETGNITRRIVKN
jgi:PKD repeat protein